MEDFKENNETYKIKINLTKEDALNDIYVEVMDAVQRNDFNKLENMFILFSTKFWNKNSTQLLELADILIGYAVESQSIVALKCINEALKQDSVLMHYLTENDIVELLSTNIHVKAAVDCIINFAKCGKEQRNMIINSLLKIYSIYFAKLNNEDFDDALCMMMQVLISNDNPKEINDVIMSTIDLLSPRKQILVASHALSCGIHYKVPIYFEEITVDSIRATGAGLLFDERIIPFLSSANDQLRAFATWYFGYITYHGNEELINAICAHFPRIRGEICRDEPNYTIKRLVMIFDLVLLIRINICMFAFSDLIDFAVDSEDPFISLLVLRAVNLNRFGEFTEEIDIDEIRGFCDDSQEESLAETYYNNILDSI